jgi:hypothetical protein
MYGGGCYVAWRRGTFVTQHLRLHAVMSPGDAVHSLRSMYGGRRDVAQKMRYITYVLAAAMLRGDAVHSLRNIYIDRSHHITLAGTVHAT